MIETLKRKKEIKSFKSCSTVIKRKEAFPFVSKGKLDFGILEFE